VSQPRRDAAVRQILDGPLTPVPPEMYADVVRRGGRMLRRRRIARRLLWLLLLAATVAFVVWALTVRPWAEPPSTTTPPLREW
jgi:ferric-dicitrate binding protein FerR (iron transport regulator)